MWSDKVLSNQHLRETGKMLSPVLFIGVVLIAVSAKSIEDASSEESESERIIAGRPASPGQFPWVVALHYNGRFICTASIISPNTVLTAAHCVKLDGEVQPADLFYGIANVRRSASSMRIDFLSVEAHPQYSEQSIDNDVAIFKTTEPIPFDENVRAICIARPNTEMREYSKATIMGWGSISPVRLFPIVPERLQYAEQVIVDNILCSFANAGVNEDKICASGGASGVCNGDSGGPLVAQGQNNTFVQIGVTSYINAIIGCGKVVPAVFTRISSFYDYIMQTANDDGSICTV